MAFHKSLWFSISIFITFLSSSHAKTFEVGGRDGWTLHPSENYNQWSGRLRFLINDTLHFKYNGGSDSVLVVNKGDYDNCNGDNPISKLSGGDSSFKFDRSGPFYFISGNKSNCDQGQKLIVVVLALRNRSPPPAAVTPPSPSPGAGSPGSPSPTAATPPSPSSPSPSPASGSPGSPSPAAGSPGSPSPAGVSPGSPSPAGVSPGSPSPGSPSPTGLTPASPPSGTPSLTPPANSPGGGSSSSPGGGTGESPGSSNPADANSPPPPGSSAGPALSGTTTVTMIVALWWFI